jgi:hypothetical protein
LNKNNINNNISINIHNPNPNSNNYHPGIANSDHNNQDDAHNSSIVINGSPKNFKNKPNEVKKSRTHLEQLIELR